MEPSKQKTKGELTLTQGGAMLVVVGAALSGAEALTEGTWVWGGIPVLYLGLSFLGIGLVLTVAGLVRRR